MKTKKKANPNTKAVLLRIPQADYNVIANAAKIEQRYVTQFLTYHAYMAARDILQKSVK